MEAPIAQTTWERVFRAAEDAIAGRLAWPAVFHAGAVINGF
ncbi:hypothetical protein [Streptomyces sp. NRRL F-5630]